MKKLCLLVAMLLFTVPAYSQTSSLWIDDLTWPEVRDAIAAGKRTAIIYVGSSEQNGPHMAIGKHNFIARALAQRIAEELARTYEWMKSWDFLETASCATDLVDMNVQQHGYVRASHEPAPVQ